MSAEPGSTGIFPKGTVLYLDWGSPEGGFDRYLVYVNIFGGHLETKCLEDSTRIPPITGGLATEAEAGADGRGADE